MRRKIVAGNWKMHGTRSFAHDLVRDVLAGAPADGVDIVLLPPMPYLGELVERFQGQALRFGAQDVSANEKGAFTGEVSAGMLVDIGARYGLVGHSERRQYHGESDALIARKFVAAKHAGLVPILCIGESLHEREAGQTEYRLETQLGAIFEVAGPQAFAGAVIAYEPVWPSAPAAPRAPNRLRRPMPSFVARSPRAMLQSPARCRSCTAAVASRTTRSSCSRSPTWTAG